MIPVSESMDPQTKAGRVRQALEQYWRTCSDREIAQMVMVSNRTISQLRKKLESEGRIVPRRQSTHSVEACQYELCTSAIEPAPLNDQLRLCSPNV